MMDILNKVENFLQPMGYITTTFGTIIGVIALIMTIKINNKTNRIENNIKHFEIKATFNAKRLKFFGDVNQVYISYKKKGQYNVYEIKEFITDLNSYEDIYTESMKKLLGDIETAVFIVYKGKIPKSKMEDVMLMIYSLQRKLENNFDIIKKQVGEKYE